MITVRFVIPHSLRNTASVSNTLGGAYERRGAVCSRSLLWKDTVAQRRHDMHASDEYGRNVALDARGITCAIWCYVPKRYENSHVRSELQAAPRPVHGEVIMGRSMRFETGPSRRATRRDPCRPSGRYSARSTVELPSPWTASAQSRAAASHRLPSTESSAPHSSTAPPA